ncbi:MAG: hypothetical protein JJE40_12315 [Vicinamibacteria bacterium]|nr:hypothetical protein [Vicinamibacteria bacterium]
MTALLVAVTFGALGVAGALLFYVLRLTREERDRSDARAAALTELIGEGASGAWSAAEVLDPAQRAPMFGSAATDVTSTRPSLLLVPAIGVLVVGLALTGIYLWNRPHMAAAAAPAASAPLELVSLRHQRQGDTLIVSGLVRNPHAGRPIKGLAAVAFTFDRQGTFLTSGRAALDFPQLGAGDESPFSIAVPQSAGVGRYRVSFRTDDGVVPHIDRREPATISSAKATVTR